jgi:Na+/proline symporter
MSTIATHLNWGSSYVVNDFYKRFVKPEASERELVGVGRISTVLMMALAAVLALFLENALQAFQILLQIGAGTGLLFLLRWFWWRINAWSEIAAMAVSFAVALFFSFFRVEGEPVASEYQLLIGVGVTTLAWVAVTLLTPPSDDAVLRSFYTRIRPGGRGWQPVIEKASQEGVALPAGPGAGKLTIELLCMAAGTAAIYGALFATGFWIYGQTPLALLMSAMALVSSGLLYRWWKQLAD